MQSYAVLSPIAESPMREHWATTAAEPPSPTSPTSPLSMPSSSRSDALECALNCKACHSSIASQECLLSEKFRGNHGKGALYSKVTNTYCHPPTLLLMNTGAYTVRTLACSGCAVPLGWRLVHAHEEVERWKDGCYLLELDLLYEGTRARRRPRPRSPPSTVPVSRFSVATDADEPESSDPDPDAEPDAESPRRPSEDSLHSIWSPDPEVDAFPMHARPRKTPLTRFAASLDGAPPPHSSSVGRSTGDGSRRLSTVSREKYGDPGRPSGPRTGRHSRLGSVARSAMVM